jgi:hypothetical protein
VIITYSPQDGEARAWDLKKVRILSSEAEAVERATDLTYAQVKDQLSKGSARALRAVGWVLAKREAPTLRYGQFDPPEDELDIDFDAEERALLREEAESNPDLTDAQREQLLEALADPASEDAGEPDPDTVPKASDAAASPTSG